MPDVSLQSQPLDLAFHPQEDLFFTAHLNGAINCYSYDATGNATLLWKVRPSKKSCRALDVRADGQQVFVGNKAGSIYVLGTATGEVLHHLSKAHDAPISRIATLGESMNMIVSGDDDGIIKLWDSRSPTEPMRTYSHHTDYISDFAWLQDKKHLVATSGDGTLSVIDVRSNKTKPFAQSEDQEDELLSVAPIKGGKKIVIGDDGTQLGPLTVFDRSKGYGDCVDRFIGHPQSVETMVSLTSSAIQQDVIATGSSDGLIRVVQIHPSKFLGVIAAHGGPSGEGEDSSTEETAAAPKGAEGFPVERMRVDRNKKWLGSISHDEILKLTDIEEALEASSGDEEEETEDAEEIQPPIEQQELLHSDDAVGEEAADSDGSEGAAEVKPKMTKKRRRQEMKRDENKRRKVNAPGSSFFDGL